MATETPTAEATTPVVPGRMCTDGWISTYLKYSQYQASPPLFHLWTAISVISAALKRHVFIDRGGYFCLYPNMYVVLVAPPGRCKKSTAARMGINILQKVDGMKITHEKLTPEGLIAHLGEVCDGDVAKVESTGNVKIKPKNDATAYVFAPELSVFIGSVSYSSGLIELLTSLYECPNEWEYKTRTKGTVVLRNVCLNFIGATNPEWMAKGFSEDVFGGGFMGRIVFVFQESRKKVAWIVGSPTAEDDKLKLLHDLVRISEMRGKFSIAPEAFDFYQNWHDEFEGDFSGRMAGYYERKPDHILKLAMVISASVSSNLIIERSHIESAVKMLDEIEALMPRAFSYVGATSEARIAYHVLDVLTNSPQHFISYKKLLIKIQHMIKNKKELEDVIDLLESAGQLKQFSRNGKRYFTLDDDIKEYLLAIEALAEEEAKQELRELAKKEKEEIKAESGEIEEKKPTNIREVVDQITASGSTKVQ